LNDGVIVIPHYFLENRPTKLLQQQYGRAFDQLEQLPFYATMKFDFLPPGLFSRLQLRVFRIGKPCVFWKHGIVFEALNELAYLEEDSSAHQLRIASMPQSGLQWYSSSLLSNHPTNTTTRANRSSPLMRLVELELQNIVAGWFSVQMTVDYNATAPVDADSSSSDEETPTETTKKRNELSVRTT